MFRLIKEIFIGLLTGIVSASNHTKWVLLSNQKLIMQPTLINIHPNKYSQEVHSQQTSAGLQDILKMSSRHVLKMSSKRLHGNNFSSSKTS